MTHTFTVAQIMNFLATNQQIVNETTELMHTHGSAYAKDYMRFEGHMSDSFADVVMEELKYRLHWK